MGIIFFPVTFLLPDGDDLLKGSTHLSLPNFSQKEDSVPVLETIPVFIYAAKPDKHKLVCKWSGFLHCAQEKGISTAPLYLHLALPCCYF